MKSAPKLRKFTASIQARLDWLMGQNNEGKLTASERKEFAQLAERAHEISIANARTLLAEQRRVGKPSVSKAKTDSRRRQL